MIRNIDRMYYNYGYGGDRFCHDCPHFKKECWNKTAQKKLIGFDEKGNEVFERSSFLACGLIDKPFPEEDAIKGQMEMEQLLES